MRWTPLIIALAAPALAFAEDARAPVIPNLLAISDESARIAVTVEPGLRSSKGLSAPLRQAREAFHAGQEISAAQMRALAQAGDGLAAQRYVRLLEAQSDAAPSDIAMFAATAVGTGRVWTLPAMIDAMERLDPETEPQENVNRYIRVLYPHAWAGNTLALDAVVKFNGEGRLFGALSDRTRTRILDQARAQGGGQIELGMATAILEQHLHADAPNDAALAEARLLLTRAATAEHLAVRATAQNMLKLMDEAAPHSG